MANVAVTAVNADELCVNTIRTLSIDAIQQANSGHPGTPMGMAPTVYALWQRVLRFDPEDPIWPNRDRFVLSAGHASMLLYSILHLVGTKAVDPDYEVLGRPSVSLDDIRNFRQPAPSARVSLPVSAWQLRGSGSPPATTARASTSLTTPFTACAETAA
jgi:transketolase